MKRRTLIAGNWKMNGNGQMAKDLAIGIVGQANEGPEYLVCPPFVHLTTVGGVVGNSTVGLGAQDVSLYDKGAYTGDISAEMLKDVGCTYVIIGHSERRQYFGETNESVAAKAVKAIEHGLIPIICVGETKEERESGQALDIIATQIESSVPASATATNTVIAYEPVWAIGTGLVPTLAEIEEVHEMLRKNLAKRLEDVDVLRIIYGGSVKPDNANDILRLEDVDGALIGGASLSVESFVGIGQAAQD